MKWTVDLLAGRTGEKRLVRRFLWLPLQIKNEKRWLESVWILEKVVLCDVGGHDEWNTYKNFWIPQKFVDNPKDPNVLAEIVLSRVQLIFVGDKGDTRDKCEKGVKVEKWSPEIIAAIAKADKKTVQELKDEEKRLGFPPGTLVAVQKEMTPNQQGK